MNVFFEGASRRGWHFLVLLLVLVGGGAWSQPAHAAVTFAVTYTDTDGEGFYDNTAYGSTTLGAARRNCFESALSYWSSHLGTSSQTVTVTASFDSLGGSSTGATLGQAGPVSYFYNFGSSNSKYQANTFYGSALANHLAGRDLDPSNPEIRAQFNSDVDNSTVLGNTSFYYGTDGKPGSNVDLYSVVLHEVGHGLNFLGLVGSDGTFGGTTQPSIYDRFLTLGNGSSRTRITDMTPTQRASAVISDNLYFDGARTMAANGNAPAKVYAPTTYQGGSSVSHLDENTFSLPNINELMTPASSGVIHDAGPVGLGVFYDEGWGIPPQVTSITRADSSPTSSRTLRFNVLFSAPVTGVDTTDFSVMTTGSIAGATVSSVSGSGSSYVVSVTYANGSGTVRLDVTDNDSIVESSNIPLGGTGTTGTANGSFTGGQTYTVAASGTLQSIIAVGSSTSNVVSIDASSGTQSVVASGSPFTNSFGVAMTSAGTVYVTNFSANTIVKIPTSGSPAALPLPSTNLLSNPMDLVIGPDGYLYTNNYGNGNIVKVDPSSGAQTIVATGGSLNSPRALTFGSDGFLYVANYGGLNILKIDRTSGAQTVYASQDTLVVSDDSYYCGSTGLAFASDGSLYVSDGPNARIIKVASGGGSATGITAFGSMSGLAGMAYGKDGNLYVANGSSNSVVRVTTSGASTTVATGGSLGGTSDVALAVVADPTLSISGPASITEGNSGTTNATFTVSLSGPSTSTVTATVGTADGTATAGSDYVALSTTVSFAPGVTSQTVTVQIKGDTTVEPDETFTLNLSNPANATLGTTSATCSILNDDVALPSSVLISEFRLSGPAGASDEYIELYNTTGSAINLTGWTLSASNVTTALSGLSLSGKSIPAYGYLLLTNSGGYSLGNTYPAVYAAASTTPSSYATGDVTYTGDIALNSTLTLVNPSGVVVDATSDLSGTNGLTASNQYAFVRRMDGASTVNTGVNSNDFNLVDIASTTGTGTSNGTSTMAVGARLGAPGPQNSASPVRRAALTLVPLNSSANGGVTPEGRYASKSTPLDTFGRLSLRRTITNTSNQTIKQIRFTLVRTTSGTSTDASMADLRALTSVGVSLNGTKYVQGIQIEAPTTPTIAGNTLTSSTTGNGGGLNSSWNVGTLPAGGLAPGQSMNVEFTFGILKEGNYDFALIATVAQ